MVFVDFDHYRPSFGAAAAFLAAPVFENGNRVGIIIGQVSIDEMNAALTSSGDWDNEGLGATGEVYLVGSDGFSRWDSRFLIQDKAGYLDQLAKLGVEPAKIAAIDQTGHSILNQRFATQAVERALSDETGADTIRDDRGQAVLPAFMGMLSEIVRRNGIIESKTAEYAKLLRNVLPDTVADRFNGGALIVADTFENVSIIYAVIVGLDAILRDHSANDIIHLLNELIDLFDESAERHGVEKVKTIGDAYLAACGLSTPRLDHRQRAKASCAALMKQRV